MVTGRDMFDDSTTPSNDYKDYFKEQIFRNTSTAHKIFETIKKEEPEDKFLIFCGMGDMAFGFGIPEKLWKRDIGLLDKTFLVYSNQDEHISQLKRSL
jgi:hypothetical protein